MHVKFKKLAVASAVSAALGVAGTAQAENSLLFPYVNTASTAFTFVSIWSDPVNDWPVGLPPHANAVNMHFYYGTKAIGAVATSACSHLDFPVSTTRGALLQFEVGTRFNLVADFGDPAGYGVTINAANNKVEQNREGFLVVEYGSTGALALNNNNRIYGEAAIINTATGVAMAYAATDARNPVNPDFGLQRDRNGDTVRVEAGAGNLAGNMYAPSEYTTSWFPRTNPVINTTWYVLPLGTRAEMTPNAPGGIRARILPITDVNNAGAFGRAEFYTSGSTPNNLRCFGTFGVNNLLTASFNSGGWMSVVADRMDATFAAAVGTGKNIAYGGHTANAAKETVLAGALANYAAYQALAVNSTRQPIALWKFQETTALGASVTTLNAVQPRQNVAGRLPLIVNNVDVGVGPAPADAL